MAGLAVADVIVVAIAKNSLQMRGPHLRMPQHNCEVFGRVASLLRSSDRFCDVRNCDLLVVFVISVAQEVLHNCKQEFTIDICNWVIREGSQD